MGSGANIAPTAVSWLLGALDFYYGLAFGQDNPEKEFGRYTEFLKGPQVWGMCAKNPSGNPFPCPHLSHVLAYDREIR